MDQERWSCHKAKQRAQYAGSLVNFLVQAAQAAVQAHEDYRHLLANGWVEVTPGLLRSPDGTQEVWFD